MLSNEDPSAFYHEENEKAKVSGHSDVTSRNLETRSYCASTPKEMVAGTVNRPMKRKEIEVRRYTGKDSVEDYLLQFELAARHNCWTDQEKTSSLLCALDGQARGVLAEIDDIVTVSYEEVRRTLLARFGPADFPAAHEQTLQQLRLSPGQNIRELSQEVQRLTRRAYSDLTGRARNQLMVGFLLRAIPERDIVFYIRDKEPRNLDEVCCLYERFRLLSSTSNHRHPTARGINSEEKGSDVDESPPSPAMRSFMDRTSHCLSQLSSAVERLSVASPSAAQSETPSATSASAYRGNIPKKPCPKCGHVGHWSRDCPLHSGTRETTDRARCFECGQPGHRWQNCPALQQSGNDRGSTSAPDDRSAVPHPEQ